MNKNQEITTLGGGCFWCLEAFFSELRGVENVVSGYSGGIVPDPSYQQVCAGATGHAEVVQITFDPDMISFKELLEQEKVARELIKEFELAKIWSSPIVTELAPFKVFYPAEEYHQEYFRRNPDQMYCTAVISPKLARFRKRYFTKLRKE